MNSYLTPRQLRAATIVSQCKCGRDEAAVNPPIDNFGPVWSTNATGAFSSTEWTTPGILNGLGVYFDRQVVNRCNILQRLAVFVQGTRRAGGDT
jgi:hypothetical protein